MNRYWKSRAASKNGHGFTLIESVVAVSVFALLMTSIMGSILAVMRVNEKSRAVRTVEQNARFLTEFITREIRNGSVDYAAYGGSIGQPDVETLRYLNIDGEPVRIWLNSGVLNMQKVAGTSFLSGNDVVVSGLEFYIKPSTNPYVSGGPNQQPYVTFTMTITSKINIRPEDQATITVQTTVSSREYPSS